jgi:hypothetical protein
MSSYTLTASLRVVIECKSPINGKDKPGEAFEQIK